MPNLCQSETGCRKRAVFNFPGEKKLLFCKECKLEGMVNVGSKKCAGLCGKYPIYNFPTETKPLFCKDCKEEGMIDVKNKKCITGCGRHAGYNYAGEKKLLYCKDCKLEGMEYVKNKKCVCGCGKYPSYNYEGEKKALYCTMCKKENMVLVIRNKCKGGCGKYPVYNFDTETRPMYCKNCKADGMVDVKNRKKNQTAVEAKIAAGLPIRSRRPRGSVPVAKPTFSTKVAATGDVLDETEAALSQEVHGLSEPNFNIDGPPNPVGFDGYGHTADPNNPYDHGYPGAPFHHRRRSGAGMRNNTSNPYYYRHPYPHSANPTLGNPALVNPYDTPGSHRGNPRKHHPGGYPGPIPHHAYPGPHHSYPGSVPPPPSDPQHYSLDPAVVKRAADPNFFYYMGKRYHIDSGEDCWRPW